jgi:hypothetical protein
MINENVFLKECKQLSQSKNFNGIAKSKLVNVAEKSPKINWTKVDEGIQKLTGWLNKTYRSKTE